MSEVKGMYIPTTAIDDRVANYIDSCKRDTGRKPKLDELEEYYQAGGSFGNCPDLLMIPISDEEKEFFKDLGHCRIAGQLFVLGTIDTRPRRVPKRGKRKQTT